MLNSSFTNDIDDSNVDQVNEELKGGHFTSLCGSPQKTLVEILPHNRPVEESKRLYRTVSVLVGRTWVVAVERSGLRVIVFGSKMGRIAIAIETGI